LFLLLAAATAAQTITASISGTVTDSTGAVLPNAKVTAVNASTGFTRSVTASATGGYQIPAVPVGEYAVTVELAGFKRDTRRIVLQIGQAATVDFSLAVGEVAQEVEVVAPGELVEPTRTSVSAVITERQIESLPVNGRQFIDFALLAPGVNVGETTSGSTDVIIEPVTKLSFAGQNIHFNFIAVDGADNISTASGVQKTTPSQEAVKEFRVINTQYSAEAGRAVGGIVNIITKSGTNELHGSLYEYFRNDALDAKSILASPGLNKLRQNQFGGTLGGPLAKDKTFLFGNYEGQRRRESPFYNSVILANIAAINTAKTTLFGTQAAGSPGTLPAEDLNQTRTFDYDTMLVKLDHTFSDRQFMFIRYYFNDARLLNVSPLNDGFDLPSAFKDNFFRDQSLVGSLTSTLSTHWLNDLRIQYAHRMFDFPTVSTQPHLEVANTFAVGVNRGNPDFYREPRFEVSDTMTYSTGRHTINFGGNFNWVRTTESFPLFYPFEATFATVQDFLNGTPFVLFMQRNDAGSNFTEPTLLPNGPAVYQGRRIPQEIRDLAKGELTHTYNGFFIQDKWRATPNLTLNFGLRYEFETWPEEALDNDLNNFDPRFGFAYSFGTSRNIVLRGGAGIFRGIIPSPLLACQRPSCGGTIGQFPGREAKENDLNATTRLFAFASDPSLVNIGLLSLLTSGTYPDAVPLGFCPDGTLATCGFFGDSVIVRFARDHQAPYGIQGSLSLELEPFPNSILNLTYLRTRGVHLGSFWNVNQPDPTGQRTLHDSDGNTGTKNTFFCPAAFCGVPDTFPFTRDPGIAVYFEADSIWDSTYDGFLVNFNSRANKHVNFGVSYTWSKTLDNGPNPSFVLIPQDITRFDEERALSSDHAAHRFVLNASFTAPTNVNPLVNDWEFGTILTLRSPHYFTKFAGFDANGDVFGVNDRVGIERRNTFKGDSLKSFDIRIARSFKLTEKVRLQGMAEAFNLFNTLNVRFFNTVYGAGDFCPVGGVAACGTGPFFFEGSPNPNYGTPRAINNPRQLQLAVRFSF
jgi:hypothetical protein